MALATAALLSSAQPVRDGPGAGFKGPQVPSSLFPDDIFKRLGTERFEAELQTWAAQSLDRRTQQRIPDGKALPGIPATETLQNPHRHQMRPCRARRGLLY